MAKKLKLPDGQEFYSSEIDIEVKSGKKNNKRVISMIGSTKKVDRDGDVIEQNGWETKAFKSNPVILWSHDHTIPAIARANKFSITDGKLVFDEIEFPEPGIHNLSDIVYELMTAGFIKAGSVGFLPIKSERRELKDEEKDRFFYPQKFLKQELIEFSICNVGSNPDALVYHLGQKGFSKQDINKLIRENEAEETSKETDKSVENKKVVPFKSYPLAEEGTSWDGPGEKAKAEVKDLKIICTWYDSEKPEIKGSYKLPHHLAESKQTVWNGVKAAMGALLGARGGVNIPDSDRRGVYNHLSKHYKEFEKEVPEFKEFTNDELSDSFINTDKDENKEESTTTENKEHDSSVNDDNNSDNLNESEKKEGEKKDVSIDTEKLTNIVNEFVKGIFSVIDPAKIETQKTIDKKEDELPGLSQLIDRLESIEKKLNEIQSGHGQKEEDNDDVDVDDDISIEKDCETGIDTDIDLDIEPEIETKKEMTEEEIKTFFGSIRTIVADAIAKEFNNAVGKIN